VTPKLEALTDYVGQWFKAYRQLGEPYEIYFDTENNGQKQRHGATWWW
jgi:hypothetical protein